MSYHQILNPLEVVDEGFDRLEVKFFSGMRFQSPIPRRDVFDERVTQHHAEGRVLFRVDLLHLAELSLQFYVILLPDVAFDFISEPICPFFVVDVDLLPHPLEALAYPCQNLVRVIRRRYRSLMGSSSAFLDSAEMPQQMFGYLLNLPQHIHCLPNQFGEAFVSVICVDEYL